MKKYKALIIDCDDTLFPARMEEFISEKVILAINQASKLMHIGIATQRSFVSAIPILAKLNLSGPSIVGGGAQIIDAQTHKVLWEKPINQKDFFQIIKMTRNIDAQIFLQEGEKSKEYIKNSKPKKVLEMGIWGLEESVADKLIEEFSGVDTIVVHKASSWQPFKYGVMITHAAATKQYGVFEVAKILNIDTHEIIGIGDSYNDFPLLMACGLKVAIGNSVKELKTIADYIAPTVYDDGVAEVINKFILC